MLLNNLTVYSLQLTELSGSERPKFTITINKDGYTEGGVERLRSGCRHPNLEPTLFNAKNALLPAVQHSTVQYTDVVCTVWRIPRYLCVPHSRIVATSTSHFLVVPL